MYRVNRWHWPSPASDWRLPQGVLRERRVSRFACWAVGDRGIVRPMRRWGRRGFRHCSAGAARGASRLFLHPAPKRAAVSGRCRADTDVERAQRRAAPVRTGCAAHGAMRSGASPRRTATPCRVGSDHLRPRL